MTGQQLSNLLFPTSTCGIRSSEKAALAVYLTKLWGKKVQPKDIRAYLIGREISDEFLRGYADYKGFDESSFLEWALGPGQTEMYTEGKPDIETDTKVSWRPQFMAQCSMSNDELKSELNAMYAENRALHEALADRDRFIRKLIGE